MRRKLKELFDGSMRDARVCAAFPWERGVSESQIGVQLTTPLRRGHSELGKHRHSRLQEIDKDTNGSLHAQVGYSWTQGRRRPACNKEK